MNILLVCGGVGGSKLALGFYKLRNKIPFSILTNTADDFEHLGLYISPDIDTVTYTLADVVNKDQGWGRDKESWNMLEELSILGGEDWFKLGDKDLSVHIYRTILLKQGKTLSEITEIISKKFNIKVPIFPIDGETLKQKGMQEGQSLGNALKTLEKEWINNNFKISDERVEEIIKVNSN